MYAVILLFSSGKLITNISHSVISLTHLQKPFKYSESVFSKVKIIISKERTVGRAIHIISSVCFDTGYDISRFTCSFNRCIFPESRLKYTATNLISVASLD